MYLDIGSQPVHHKANFHTEERYQQIQWSAFGVPGFIDRYTKHKAHILIHLRKRDGSEFIACVQMCNGALEIGDLMLQSVAQISAALTNELLFLGWSESMAERTVANRQEQPVFIDDIELMKQPQVVVPSFVWIEAVDLFYRILPQAFYLSRHKGFISLGIVEYWETCMFRIRSCASGLDHLPNQVVECASEVLKSVTKNERNVGGNLGHAGDIVGSQSGIQIILSPDSVWIGLSEGIQAELEIIDVLLGPVVLS